MSTADPHSTATGRRLTATWLVAGLLTIASWATAIAVDSGRNKTSTTVAIVGLALGTVKVRLIIRQFMDVRTAPRWLKTFTDVWLAVLTATVLAMYLAA